MEVVGEISRGHTEMRMRRHIKEGEFVSKLGWEFEVPAINAVQVYDLLWEAGRNLPCATLACKPSIRCG